MTLDPAKNTGSWASASEIWIQLVLGGMQASSLFFKKDTQVSLWQAFCGRALKSDAPVKVSRRRPHTVSPPGLCIHGESCLE